MGSWSLWSSCSAEEDWELLGWPAGLWWWSNVLASLWAAPRSHWKPYTWRCWLAGYCHLGEWGCAHGSTCADLLWSTVQHTQGWFSWCSTRRKGHLCATFDHGIGFPTNDWCPCDMPEAISMRGGYGWRSNSADDAPTCWVLRPGHYGYGWCTTWSWRRSWRSGAFTGSFPTWDFRYYIGELWRIFTGTHTHYICDMNDMLENYHIYRPGTETWGYLYWYTAAKCTVPGG